MKRHRIQYLNLDSEESVFFENELTAIMTELIETDYPAMKARTYIPVRKTADAADVAFKWREVSKVGSAKIVADYANDFPLVDITGKENVGKIESLGAGYAMTVQEIRAAKKTGRPLESMKAIAAREAIGRLEESIAWLGSAEYNLPGFLNCASIPEVTGIHGSWSTATADEILEDLVALDSAPYINTKEIETPTTMFLPLAQYRLIHTKRIDDTDITVAEFFLKTSFVKEIVPLERLNGYGYLGADRAMVFTRDPKKVWLEIPMDIEQGDPIAKGRSFEVPLESRCGGVAWIKPLSAAYCDNI